MLAFLGSYLIFKYKEKYFVYWAVVISFGAISFFAPYLILGKGFIVATAWCYAIFGGGFILSLACSLCAFSKFKITSIFFGIISLALPIVAIETFLIEPYTITVRHETLVSPKIKRPIKLLVLADIQTDVIGEYERKVLARAMQEKADLIILCGDYIQTEPSRDPVLCAKFRTLLKDIKLDAPLGVYVIQGDMEWEPNWQEIFSGLPYELFPQTRTIEKGDFVFTGLTLYDSRSILKLPDQKKFHIVAGHAPDYSIMKPNADLFIAGHTHGGQVQLPFLGPIITGSILPRSQAAGCFTQISQNPKKYLMISRGIGMERLDAPRMRFLCLPEIVVIDLMPLK